MRSKYFKKFSKASKHIKKNKRNLLLIVIGTAITFLVFLIYRYIIAPGMLRLLYSKYPEIEVVSQAVHDKYQNANISIMINTFTYTNYGSEPKTETSTRLIINFHNGNELRKNDIKYIGNIACDKLKQMNKHYDSVIVVTHKSLLPINIPFLYLNEKKSYSGKC